MKINFQVFDSLPSPGSLSDALADKLRMSRTSLAEVVIMMTVVMTILMTAMMTGNAYLIFVIFFTLAKFLENKIYTEKRQFFALNL